MSIRRLQIILFCFSFWQLEALAQQTLIDLSALVAEYESAARPQLILRDLLAPAATIVSPALSPNGELVVYGEIEGLQTNLSVLDTQSLQERTLFNTSRLANLYWTSDSEKIIFELDNAIGYLPVNFNASPSYMSTLDRSEGDYFLGPDGSSSEHVLIVRMSEDDYSLERVNLAGEIKELYRTQSKIVNAVYTANGGPLFLQLESEIDQNIYRLEAGKLDLIISCGVLDECYLEVYDPVEQVLWVRMDAGVDRLSLFSWNAEVGEAELVHADPIERAILFNTSYVNSSPAVMQYPSSALISYGFGQEEQRHLQALNEFFPSYDFNPYPSSGAYWLIVEHGAVLREANYYLYNTNTRSVEQILVRKKQSPAIDSSLFSQMHYFQYPARDGLLIHGFLLLPKGRDIGSSPMVTYAHGGPFSRVASQQYSDELQMLTNRGYIVFVPNFRGSTGYGKKYLLSSNKDFGDGVVQRDIIDGVNFLLSNGIGNEDRLAIIGGSFGGFSVLAGLAFTPDLFKAGYAAVPPADLVNGLMDNAASDDRNPIVKEKLRRLMVDKDDPTEVQLLYDKSPRASLKKMTAPLVVLAGADDQGVDINHVKEYSLALLNNGNAITLLIDEDEGHLFSSDESTAAYLYLMEEFLALYLGGEREGLNDGDLRNYLRDKIQINSNADFLTGL